MGEQGSVNLFFPDEIVIDVTPSRNATYDHSSTNSRSWLSNQAQKSKFRAIGI